MYVCESVLNATGRQEDHPREQPPWEPFVLVEEATNVLQVLRLSSTIIYTSRQLSGRALHVSNAGDNHEPNIQKMNKNDINERKKKSNITKQSMKKSSGTIQRVREEGNWRRRKNEVLPVEYCYTAKGAWILGYLTTEKIPILMYMYIYEKNVDLLPSCACWLADGTFDVFPNVSAQLYTIHGMMNAKLVRLVSFFIPDKRKQNYCAGMKELKRLHRDLNPKQIIIDFDLEFFIACKEVFPNAEVKGSLFHFGQRLWRQVQFAGLQEQYENDRCFANRIKMLKALAYVPTEQVVYAFNKLMRLEFYVENKDTLAKVVDYFEITWIGAAKPGRKRRAPFFPIDMWNCYTSVLDDSLRSNYAVREWNRSFYRRTRTQHLILLEHLKLHMAGHGRNEDQKFDELIAGVPTTTRRKMYRDIEKDFHDYVARYWYNDILVYLRDIARNISL